MAYANDTLYVATRNRLYAIDAAASRQTAAEAGYWPQWRGANRDNRSSETELLKSWPEQGPPLAWRVDGLGDGIASVAIADGRIFTTTTYGNAEYAVAIDERTGQSLWHTEVGFAVPENRLMRWLSQRTPTIDGDRVYVFTNSGWLVCLSATDGWIKWRISYPHEFGAKQGSWGFCDRPLIDGNKLICTPCGTKDTVVALDKLTGKKLWSTELENQRSAAYASAVQMQTDGLKQYVVFLSKGIVSLAADDGRILWSYDRTANRIANTHTPLALSDGLLCPNGYSGCISRLRLTRRENSVSYEELYFVKENFDPFEDSSMLVQKHLYALLSMGMPACIDIETGKTVWKARGSGTGKSAATYADGHLYFRWADGTIGLVEASPAAYMEKSHFKLDEPRNSLGSTFPVIAGGGLYIRDNDRLHKYDVKLHPANFVAPETRFVTLERPKESQRPPLPAGQRIPIAIFVPTPHDVVAKMLEMAQLSKDDVLTDLGSGDGRILVEAAKQYKCRAIGIELDEDLVALSKEKISESNVNTLVTIKMADLFETDFSKASVVTAYVYRDMLQRLIPQFKKLKSGSRIITHQFDIPGFRPAKTLKFDSQETGAEHTIYLWTIPL
ncbi:MAG: PQQ-binding-like beta-propeller repeat protein, partial [Aureliella sp.]